MADKIGRLSLFKIDYNGKKKTDRSPVYNIKGEIDANGRLVKFEGAGWIAEVQKGDNKGQKYISCNLNPPYEGDSGGAKNDELDELF